MKPDPYFKFLSVVVIAGVLIALFDPSPAGANPPTPPAVLATTR